MAVHFDPRKFYELGLMATYTGFFYSGKALTLEK
jgi:hypothetical protein